MNSQNLNPEKEWHWLRQMLHSPEYQNISQKLNDAALNKLNSKYPKLRIDNRFIPFMAIHEFEALLFSDSDILAQELVVEKVRIDSILEKYGSLEAINNSPHTAPSKVLSIISKNGFSKTGDGINIASKIGIDTIRKNVYSSIYG